MMGFQLEGRQHARAGQHGPIEILAQPRHPVHGDGLLGPVPQQLRLIQPAFAFKIRDGLLPRPFFLFKGQVFADQRLHILLQPAHILMGQRALLRLDIQPMTHRVLHPHPHAGKQPLHAGQKQESQRPLIQSAAFLMLIRQRYEAGVRLQCFGQFQHPAAAHAGQYGAACGICAVCLRKQTQGGLQLDSFRDIQRAVLHGDANGFQHWGDTS